MALGSLTSTLTVLERLESHLRDLHPLSEAAMVKSWPEERRTLLRMILIAAAVGGIEFCYAAETALVSPLLLQLGVPVYLMTLCWTVSPLIGFFLVPILGSASDTCTSRLGRRRPFIIIYSVGIIIGLLLVPYGKDIGELLGDNSSFPIQSWASPSNRSTVNITTTLPGIIDIITHNDHRIGIIFTIIGVIVLDLCCDACQTPCRTLMVDLTTIGEQSKGLSMFTIIAGAGGAVGYAIAGIGYHADVATHFIDPEFFHHVQVVFAIVLGIYIVGSFLTVFSVSEKRLNKVENSRHKYKRMFTEYKEEGQTSEREYPSEKSLSVESSSQSLQLGEVSVESHEDKRKSESESIMSQLSSSEEEQEQDIEKTSLSQHRDYDSMPQDVELDTAEVDIRVFLKSIIYMPKHMWILCLTNLFCWMSVVTYSLYFTDFVGQAIYSGDPKSLSGTDKREAYEKGVRMGSLAMVLYSVSCCLYSFTINYLIDKLGTKLVYVCGQLSYCVGMTALAATSNIVVAFLSSITTGIMYATTFTLPYILVSRYHFDKSFSSLKDNDGKSTKQLRGLGTDIAIVSSMVFAGQFILSGLIGYIIHAAKTTVMVPVMAALLSLCGAMTALKIEYVGY